MPRVGGWDSRDREETESHAPASDDDFDVRLFGGSAGRRARGSAHRAGGVRRCARERVRAEEV
jgi:hypothetical protein